MKCNLTTGCWTPTTCRENGKCIEMSSAPAPSKVASPSGAFSVTGGSARSGYEIIQSLRREGWTEDCMTMVFKSRDGQLVKIVWPDGKTAEARIEPNDQAQRPRTKGAENATEA